MSVIIFNNTYSMNDKYVYLIDYKLNLFPVEICGLHNLCALHLNNNLLKKIPKEIGNLYNLGTLHLENNLLENLPKEICNLINLKYLNLSSNKLTVLPEDFSNLVNLEQLFLEKNQIKSLPKKMYNFSNLNFLNLENNHLDEDTINDLSCIECLKDLSSLRTLSLVHNQLKKIPKEIGTLVKLEYLYLNDNRLNDLPKEISSLKQLKLLDLLNNQLTKIPKEILKIKNKININETSYKLNDLDIEAEILLFTTLKVPLENLPVNIKEIWLHKNIKIEKIKLPFNTKIFNF